MLHFRFHSNGLSAFDGFSHIYTDGSKEAAAAVMVMDYVVFGKWLPDLFGIGSGDSTHVGRIWPVSTVSDTVSLSCLLPIAIQNRKAEAYKPSF